jgi:hypothetical protein
VQQPRPIFTLTFTPTSDCQDPIKSVRFFVKQALRQHQLRCIAAEELIGDRLHKHEV